MLALEDADRRGVVDDVVVRAMRRGNGRRSAAASSGRRRRRAPPRRDASAAPERRSAFARESAAAIAKRSAPTSTRRKSSACRFSSFGPWRSIWWKRARASAPRRALDVPHVPRERPELREPRPASPAEPARRVPPGVVRRHPRQRGEARAERRLRIRERAGDGEMPVDRLARDEEPHDLRRSLEDEVDPEVAHHALDRDRALRRGSGANRRSRSRGRRGSASSGRRSSSPPPSSTSSRPPPRGGCRGRPCRPSTRRGR